MQTPADIAKLIGNLSLENLEDVLNLLSPEEVNRISLAIHYFENKDEYMKLAEEPELRKYDGLLLS